MSEEQQLVARARDGDGAAIEALYRAHAERVYAVVRRLTADEAQAEDAAQECWLRAIRALPEFRGEARFSTWLHRIAVNCALYGRRVRARRQARELPAPDGAEWGGGAAADAGEPLLRQRLERALERLPEGMRRVLVLHDVEGYTHEEIGDLLGVAPGTCKSQLFKARAKMRALLRPLNEGERVCSI